MRCTSCGAENEPGRKFCGECGASLARACPSCGTPNPPSVKFCGECGHALGETPSTVPAPSAPAAERRVVSVLFADLVGFTTLSESRDAEEVRELLGRYFDTCRTLIERYGGTVEKFIGDAVMAVWGAPVATEHDAERTVRAALDLVAAVAALGEEVGAPDLQARAGVLTGEAAVNLGATGQGMVAGDMVNTASRIQSAAEPGTVLVGEATKRATEATIVYADAGDFALKGKAEPVPLWRAMRVVAGAQGALKAVGLEPPFVGRDRELRLVKDLFHASADDRKAHLVSVTGIAGIGKSRLSWEFYKYFDGLEQLINYHRGRCLSYGEGVAYWALVEMVKMRARIAEDEDPESSLTKLRRVLEDVIADPEERRWVEPRLAHLLGLEARVAAEKEELFSAWRLFFERLAEGEPVVMIFEDLQWADAAMLDFIEYLMEWSRHQPIFVLTLSRPELADRRPGWGANKRSFTSLYLEPLPDAAMRQLLGGLVPGLPGSVAGQILDRAQGVPLYAVETVRMLLDRGALVQEGSVYAPTGPIAELDVPETLHALIAARLDALGLEERRAVQDGAVLGKTFFKEGLERLSGITGEDLDRTLASLVRKEILTIQTDTRSPEYGQYGFLQDLLKTVAYETLSRHDRKEKHLEAAAFVKDLWTGDEDEIVEVLASHYLRAYEAVTDAPDAPEIKALACEMVVRAGERASSLAASEEAFLHFERAAELTDDRRVKAELLEKAGLMAVRSARFEEAESYLEHAAEVYEQDGEPRRAAAIRGRIAHQVWTSTGRHEDALARAEESLAVLTEGEPDAELAELAARYARMKVFVGDQERASEINELALTISESLLLPNELSTALNTKGIALLSQGRTEEAQALLRHAATVAIDNDLPDVAIGALGNLAELLNQRDRFAEATETHRQGLAMSRRSGNRPAEWAELSEIAFGLSMTGAWDEALELAAQVPIEEPEGATAGLALCLVVPPLLVARGHTDEARAVLERFRVFATSRDEQERTMWDASESIVLRAEGHPEQALSSARQALDITSSFGVGSFIAKWGIVEGTEAALELRDLDAAEGFVAIVDGLKPGAMPPFLRAHAARLHARIADARGGSNDVVEAGFKAAAGMFRELDTPFWLAVSLLEHGGWLRAKGAPAPMVDEARQIFERLRAEPWLLRADRASMAVGA